MSDCTFIPPARYYDLQDLLLKEDVDFDVNKKCETLMEMVTLLESVDQQQLAACHCMEVIEVLDYLVEEYRKYPSCEKLTESQKELLQMYSDSQSRLQNGEIRGTK